MSAHEELRRDGFFGPECLGLLTRLMRREARAVPVLEPPGGWSEHAVDDLVQEFFAAKGKTVTRRCTRRPATTTSSEHCSAGRCKTG